MLDRHEKTYPIPMKLQTFVLAFMVILACGDSALAWGPDGHSAIGRAMLQLAPGIREKLMATLGVASEQGLNEAVDEACFWPDTVRETPEWSWSGPQHYVNIPRSADHYDRQRDCPDGLCVTEAISKYAAQLQRPEMDAERRWRAFAWLCHLVGDLHQPLHAGFRDDRGGNRVEIEYLGERSNLHRFWDSLLAAQRLQGNGWAPAFDAPFLRGAGSWPWQPQDVISWTEESHALASGRAYPPQTTIDQAFADASWELIQLQWLRAAARLASLLETVLATESAQRH